MKPILHKRVGAPLFFMMVGLAAMTTAQAGERRCTFYEDPSADGNVFEPPRWPACRSTPPPRIACALSTPAG
ncbi:hypothetical protein RBA41_04700 [Massilia sp. CCM 9210]|uniref:hypothetical protein n=1 Tax=Massilia scottii TaxID=3057166 RepID=UPI002796766C|nr:hypothetical protein [Massilia sp. CCM 9210]MDQ1812598.1 hypothetical protein [Massilia sp. CCM 9210]